MFQLNKLEGTIRKRLRAVTCTAIGFAALTLAACGTAAQEAIPTRAPAPTFTPTTEAAQPVVDPSAAATAQALAEAAQNQPAQPAPAGDGPTPTPLPEVPTDTPPPPPPTDTPEANPEVVVNSAINVRGGPGTNYNVVGSANVGQRFRVTGRNDAGDWWQIDFNGSPGWVFAQLVTPTNTESVAVAANIPAPPPPPPPTNTPVPQPAPQQPEPQQPEPQQPEPQQPAGNYEFNRAILQKCDPNAGVTYVQGTTYKGGQPVNGYNVAFSYAPDGPIVATIQSGPHEGYEGWNTGFYSHIIQHDGPREGTWFFWIVDGSGNRISAIADVHTDGETGDGKCQQAVIDFDS